MYSIIIAAVLAATNICDIAIVSETNYLTSSHNEITDETTVYFEGGEITVNTEDAISTVIATNAPVVTDNAPMYGSGVWRDGSIIACPPTDPTERTETSTVTEITTLTLTWDGEPYTVTRDRVIRTVVKRFKLTPSKWVELKD